MTALEAVCAIFGCLLLVFVVMQVEFGRWFLVQNSMKRMKTPTLTVIAIAAGVAFVAPAEAAPNIARNVGVRLGSVARHAPELPIRTGRVQPAPDRLEILRELRSIVDDHNRGIQVRSHHSIQRAERDALVWVEQRLRANNEQRTAVYFVELRALASELRLRPRVHGGFTTAEHEPTRQIYRALVVLETREWRIYRQGGAPSRVAQNRGVRGRLGV